MTCYSSNSLFTLCIQRCNPSLINWSTYVCPDLLLFAYYLRFPSASIDLRKTGIGITLNCPQLIYVFLIMFLLILRLRYIYSVEQVESVQNIQGCIKFSSVPFYSTKDPVTVYNTHVCSTNRSSPHFYNLLNNKYIIDTWPILWIVRYSFGKILFWY